MNRVPPHAAFAVVALFLSSVGAVANTITVNSDADSGGICPGATCTLRQAILTALPGDTIDFAASVTTINLTSAELVINKSLTIIGPGAKLLTIQRSTASGTPDFRIFNIVTGDVSISGLIVSNGHVWSPSGTEHGAGILNGSGTLTVTECVIKYNTSGAQQADTVQSIPADGGGISNPNGGTVNIIGSTLSGNSATEFGAAIDNSNGGKVTILNSTLSGNNSLSSEGLNRGGAIYNSTGGAVNIINSTISGNKAFSGLSSFYSNGGGIYNNDGMVTLKSCTVAGNRPDGIYNDGGPVSARNTIIATNLRHGGDPEDFVGTLTSQGYNLIGNARGTNITGDTTGNRVGVDAKLGPLQDNGGPTFTHALLPGSPAIDAGNSSGLNTDQRGLPRPDDKPFHSNVAGGDGSDIGAYESQAGPASLNISTRARVQRSDEVMIAGFIITGNAPKKVLLRGLGPSLANAGIPANQVLSNPFLELHDASGALITANDNWKESPQRAQFEGTVFEPTDDREAVILTTLPTAGYTAVVKGVANSIGVGLVEAYDLDQGSDSTLTNISTRAFIGTGSHNIIAGFILGSSNDSSQIIIRGLGPSLAAFGVANPVANPRFEVRDANGTLRAGNDNWKDSPTKSQVTAAGLQPSNDLEAATAVGLSPGAYTAILTGPDGVATIEVYNLR